MEQRELKIAGNMLAIAKRKKGKNKRSIMLRTIMPFLSRETGDELADAISRNDSTRFSNVWNKVRGEISAKLAANHKHAAHAASEEQGIKSFADIFQEVSAEFDAISAMSENDTKA